VTIRRRTLAIILACALGLPLAASVPGRATASCALTWTGLMTSSKSVTDGLATFTGTVKYKLEMNTCNLGIYTRIYVDSFTNKVVIGHNSMYPNGIYISDAAFLWRDCNKFGEGCLVYPGVAAYTDNRDFLSTHDANDVSTIVRTAYPRVTYTYSTWTATQDAYRFIDGGPIWKFIYQFRRGVIYH